MLHSVMTHQFSMVPKVDVPRSKFDRSCGYKTTFNSGYLVPFFVDEVLPGDTFSVNATIFSRLTTPIVPIMDNIFMDTFFFYVPNRLIWDNWQKFNGEQENPGDSTDYLVPQVNAPSGGFPVGSLADYFGQPTSVAGISLNALYFRAYNLIYNEWFRDENLQDSLPVPKNDGPDDWTTNYVYPGSMLNDYDDGLLVRRGKRHDYFTSCLPWPQKGPGVELPLGSTAPVVSVGTTPPVTPVVSSSGSAFIPIQTTAHPGQYYFGATGALNGNFIDIHGGDNAGTEGVRWSSFQNGGVGLAYNPGSLQVDLSTATAATINSLRQAFQLQKFYEKDARGGTRYTEILRSHFGVVSPDARLQRPEYLGGSSNRINIYPVEQNSSTDITSPLGTLGAYGVCGSTGNGFTKSFVEHGVIIGLVNVRADLTYQQGIDKMFSRRNRVEYYWPSFAHLGEQAVLNKEIYATGTASDDDVFGYQERYAEYRYKPSKITGKFRSNDPQSLQVWHLSQYFTEVPKLNSSFIQDNPPIRRVLAVQDEPEFLFDSYIQNICIRPMPMYSVPGLVDHF